jgi:hypothetical protein
MRTIQLIFPFLKNKTSVTQLLPGEKKLVVKKNTAKTLTIVLSGTNHLKFNLVSVSGKEVVLNTDGFEAFWIERSGLGLWSPVQVNVCR